VREPEDSDEKIDKHDGCGENVDEEHDKGERWPSRAARNTAIIQVDSSVVATAIHVA